ncbi:MAG: MmcQ/YjbR family DNA-binding protein [Bacteroidales bacterium]|jgi:predicted DNA-binding protein (MmcQ/YjbR family)|nr:MmcQ/YjbR family DNA-binding protein [Bacteroidales bacterium]
MDIEILREYCLSKKGVTECFPFDEDTLVFKVGSRMFAFSSLERSCNITLKCDPDKAIELREKYTSITGAFHMNKTYWNSLNIDGSIPQNLIQDLIDHSYDLVFAKLSRKEKEKII